MVFADPDMQDLYGALFSSTNRLIGVNIEKRDL
jgi:hypothetical protein